MKFNEILKSFRKQSNMTQVQLAEKLNVAQGTIANWERGMREPDMETIKRIAEALSVPVERLFSDQSETIAHDIDHLSTTEFELVPPPVMKSIPVIGEVAAGYTCLADMQIIDYVACDASLLHTGYDYVYLKVKGDSMEPELHEGDLVLVRVQDTIESGEYAVARLESQLVRVKEAYAAGIDTLEEYKENKQRILAQIETVRAKQKPKQARRYDLDRLRRAESLLTAGLELYRSDAPEDAKNTALKALIGSITFDSTTKNVVITYR